MRTNLPKYEKASDSVRSLAEFAALANVSLATLRRLIAAGDGPPITQISPRRIGIRDSHGQAWLDARTRNSTAA
jgi:predicted DNA-binding transcriptional regulator AlpA